MTRIIINGNPVGGTDGIDDTGGGAGSGTKQEFIVFAFLPGFAAGATYDAGARTLSGTAPDLIDGLYPRSNLAVVETVGVIDAAPSERTKNGAYDITSYDDGTGALVLTKMDGFGDDGDYAETIRAIAGQNNNRGLSVGVSAANGVIWNPTALSTTDQAASVRAPRSIAVERLVDFPVAGTLTVDPSASVPVSFANAAIDFPDVESETLAAFTDIALVNQTDARLNGPWYIQSTGSGSFELRKRWPKAGQLLRNTELLVSGGKYANTRWRMGAAVDSIDPGVTEVTMERLDGGDLYHKTYDHPTLRRWSPEVAMGGESLDTNKARNQISVSGTADITTTSDLVADSNGRKADRDVFSLPATANDSFLRPSREKHLHINNDTDWTFGCWYKASSAPAIGHYLALHWVADNWVTHSSSFQVNSSGHLTMQANGNPIINLYTGASLADGNWHSIVLLATGTSLQVYIDGVLVNTVNFTVTTTQSNHTMRYLYCDAVNPAFAANLIHYLYLVAKEWITDYHTAGPGGNLQLIGTVPTIPN